MIGCQVVLREACVAGRHRVTHPHTRKFSTCTAKWPTRQRVQFLSRRLPRSCTMVSHGGCPRRLQSLRRRSSGERVTRMSVVPRIVRGVPAGSQSVFTTCTVAAPGSIALEAEASVRASSVVPGPGHCWGHESPRPLYCRFMLCGVYWHG